MSKFRKDGNDLFNENDFEKFQEIMENCINIIEMLQIDIADWAKRNFPNATYDEPFMGIVEEVGELSHAFLKQRQGIRGTYGEHEVAAKDAIGDLFIFMSHLCSLRGWNLSECVVNTWNKVSKRNWIKNKNDGVSS